MSIVQQGYGFGRMVTGGYGGPEITLASQVAPLDSLQQETGPEKALGFIAFPAVDEIRPEEGAVAPLFGVIEALSRDFQGESGLSYALGQVRALETALEASETLAEMTGPLAILDDAFNLAESVDYPIGLIVPVNEDIQLQETAPVYPFGTIIIETGGEMGVQEGSQILVSGIPISVDETINIDDSALYPIIGLVPTVNDYLDLNEEWCITFVGSGIPERRVWYVGPSSFDSVRLIPDWSYSGRKVAIRSDHRMQSGKAVIDQWGAAWEFQFGVRFAVGSEWAKVNSWFDNQLSLEFFPIFKTDSGTEVSTGINVRIANMESPFQSHEKYNDGYWKGRITLREI